MIPEPIARKITLSHLTKKDSLEVAMLNTDDLSSIEFIKKKVGLKILPRLTDNDSIKKAPCCCTRKASRRFGDLIQQDALSLKALTENSAETRRAMMSI